VLVQPIAAGLAAVKNVFSPENVRDTRVDQHAEYRALRPFEEAINHARDALAEVSWRFGIHQRAFSRSETGRNKSPTLDTLWRYAAAVEPSLVPSTEAIRDTRPAQGKAKRVRAARER
jgi:hypothetical protein